MKKEYTIDDLFNAKDEGQREILVILRYLLNKNSHPLPRGVDYERFFDEIQELEHYLDEMTRKY